MRPMILLTAGALYAATATAVPAQVDESQKNECVLASRNCATQVDDIYQRMQRLDREIQKGTRVYTPQELKRLQQKLAETQEMLKKMEKPGR